MLRDATKCSSAIMQSGKEYVCLMELHGDVGEDALENAFRRFTGPIYQVPPIRSSVARRPRVRHVYRISVLERVGRHVLFEVACSGGTYIRKLCHDLGEFLGVGAHMKELRRTRAGPFVEASASSLLDVYEAWTRYRESGEEEAVRRVVQPVERSVELVGRVYVLDSAVDALCHGADLAVPGISRLETGIQRGDAVAMMTLKGEVVALGSALMSSEEMMNSTEGVAVDTERVVMRRHTYPSIWRGGRRPFQYKP